MLERQQRMRAEMDAITVKVARLYKAMENCVIALDDELKGRIARLKVERDIAQEALDRIKSKLAAKKEITLGKIDQFTKPMRARLRGDDVSARKAWLGSLIPKIEIDDDDIRKSGSKVAVSSALIGPLIQHPPVLGFTRKWRAKSETKLQCDHSDDMCLCGEPRDGGMPDHLLFGSDLVHQKCTIFGDKA